MNHTEKRSRFAIKKVKGVVGAVLISTLFLGIGTLSTESASAAQYNDNGTFELDGSEDLDVHDANVDENEAASISSNTDPAAQDAYNKAQIDDLNEYRADKGLNELKSQDDLNAFAKWKIDSFAKELPTIGDIREFNQTGGNPHYYDGKTLEQQYEEFHGYPPQSWLGENLAYTTGYIKDETAGELSDLSMEMWDRSPGHKANMVNENYGSVGTGYWTDENGTYYAIQVFESGERVVTEIPAPDDSEAPDWEDGNQEVDDTDTSIDNGEVVWPEPEDGFENEGPEPDTDAPEDVVEDDVTPDTEPEADDDVAEDSNDAEEPSNDETEAPVEDDASEDDVSDTDIDNDTESDADEPDVTDEPSESEDSNDDADTPVEDDNDTATPEPDASDSDETEDVTQDDADDETESAVEDAVVSPVDDAADDNEADVESNTPVDTPVAEDVETVDTPSDRASEPATPSTDASSDDNEAAEDDTDAIALVSNDPVIAPASDTAVAVTGQNAPAVVNLVSESNTDSNAPVSTPVTSESEAVTTAADDHTDTTDANAQTSVEDSDDDNSVVAASTQPMLPDTGIALSPLSAVAGTILAALGALAFVMARRKPSKDM